MSWGAKYRWNRKIDDIRPSKKLCQRVRAAGNTKYLKCTNVGCDESVKLDDDYWPDCKPEGPLFSAEFVCVCVCVCVTVCVSDRHLYPSTLTDFDETWLQGPYCDLVWPRP